MELTEEELQKKLDEAVANAKKGLLSQEQFDEALKKRLSEKEAKHKAELEEMKKTADMSAEEKQKHAFDELTKERDELKGLLAKKEHLENLTKLMTEKKVSAEFLPMFSGISDIKEAGDMMDKFNQAFAEKVKQAKDELIAPHTPSIQNNTNPSDDAEIDRIMGIKPNK